MITNYKLSMYFAFIVCVLTIFPNSGLARNQQQTSYTVTVSGAWAYQNKSNGISMLPYARVEFWDANTPFIDTFLGSVKTSSTGNFTKTVTNNDLNGLDIYVKVFARDDTLIWVGSSKNNINSNYFETSSVYDNWITPTLNIGTLLIVNNKEAFYIFDMIANKAWNYLYVAGDYNANSNDLKVEWSDNSSTGPYYDLANTIFLRSTDGWDEDVILHEFGHYIMHKTYGIYPSAPNCGIHVWNVSSSLGCAWTEAWASYFQVAVLNDPIYTDTEPTSSVTFNLEDTPSNNSASIEGSVGASLWDIHDSNNEIWDQVQQGFNSTELNGIWAVTTLDKPNDIDVFESNWMIGSVATVDKCKVRNIFYHHSIGNANLRCGFIYIPIAKK